MDQIFGSRTGARVEIPAGFEFPLRGSTTVAELEDMYGIKMNTDRAQTLNQAIRRKLGPNIASGQIVPFGPIGLRVRVTSADSIEQVGMTILPEPSTQAEEVAADEPSITGPAV